MENAGPDQKLQDGNFSTILQGWKMQDWKKI